MFLAEERQVALPVPEGLPPTDLRRPALDPALARDRGGAGPAAVAGPAPPARLGQVAVEAVPAPVRSVDVPVDGLVADGWSVRCLPLEPSGDLSRRPAGLQALDHVRPQAVVGGRLAASLPAPVGQILGGEREVAAEARVAVAEAVAAELAVDRGTVPAEAGRDLADGAAGLDEPEEGAPLVQVELAVGSWHRHLPGEPPQRLGSRASR